MEFTCKYAILARETVLQVLHLLSNLIPSTSAQIPFLPVEVQGASPAFSPTSKRIIQRILLDSILPEIYVISILNFTMRGVAPNDRAINHYTIRTEDGLQLTNSVHYVTVELPKLPKDLPDSPTQSEGVLYLLDHLGGMDRIPVKLKDIGLENIIGLATFASMNSLTQQEYIARIMDEIDARSQIRTALEEGRVEGREEGMAKGLKQGLEEGKARRDQQFVSVMRSQGYTEEQISSILDALGN